MPMRITAKMVERTPDGLTACPNSLAFFKKHWPTGIVATPDNIARAVGRWGHHAAGIISWAATCLFPDAAWLLMWEAVTLDVYRGDGANSRSRSAAYAEAFISIILAFDLLEEQASVASTPEDTGA